MFHCCVCGHETKSVQNMKVHANQHTGDRPYQCEVCGQTFKGPSNLHAHKRQHSDILKYDCPLCDRSFRDRGTFRQHTRRHMGDKRHVCEHCGKSFVISTDLKKHLRVHSGEKPYHCNVCGKGFGDGSGMIRHQKMHTRKTRFECGACSKVFTRKDLCNYHIKKVHADLGTVDVREINIEELTKMKGVAEPKTPPISSSGAARDKKSYPPKKTWQNLERLTEEATKRLQDQAVQNHSQDQLQRLTDYQHTVIVPPVHVIVPPIHFHPLPSTGQEYGSQPHYYQELYPQEPIQNL